MKHLHDLVEHMSYEEPKAGRSTFQNLQGPLIYLFHVSGGTFTFTERDTNIVLLLLRFPRKRRRKSRFFMTTSQKF